jgi:hypothetical protein
MSLVTAGQKPVFAGVPETLEALSSADFDPRHVVYLPPEASKFISGSDAATAKVALCDFTAHTMKLDVETTGSSLVVVAQTFYHPWRAYVDDKPTRLWRANHAFQALEVPAGRHGVKLVYEDRMFQFGAVVSGITLFACGLLAFRKRREGSA